jgi:hypothetical protein
MTIITFIGIIIICILQQLIIWSCNKRIKSGEELIDKIAKNNQDLERSGKEALDLVESFRKNNKELQNSISLYIEENKMLKQNKEKNVNMLLHIKKKYEEISKEWKEWKDLLKEDEKLNRIDEATNIIIDTLDVLKCYQKILSKKEVKYALMNSENSKETVIHLEMLEKKMTKLNQDLYKILDKNHIQALKETNNTLHAIMPKNEIRRPFNAIIEVQYEKKPDDNLSFDTLYAKTKEEIAKLPTTINTQEDLISHISMLITLKRLDNPLITYEESDDRLKDVKFLIEKFEYLTEQAKKKNPDWIKKK